MLVLLFGVIAAKANAPSKWNYVGDNYSGTEHVVLVGLVDASGNALSFGDNDEVWLGAFLGEECRGQAAATKQSGIWYFPMRIKGTTADNGKQVDFRIYKNRTEYNVVGESTLAYSNETESNLPSNLFKLKFVEPTSYSFPTHLTVKVGESLDLLRLLKLAPEGANVPNIQWDFSNNQDYIKVENNVLYGLAPRLDAYLGIYIGGITSSDPEFYGASVDVILPITGITLNDGYNVEQEVFVDDTEALTDIMNNCYTVLPAESNEELIWTCSDPSAISESLTENYEKQWTPKTAGHYTLTLIGGDHSVQLKLYIKNHIQKFDPAIETIHLFVGDDLAPMIPYSFTTYPAEYVDTDYKYYVNQNSTILEQNDQDGTLKAVAVGSALLFVSPKDNVTQDLSAAIEVVVHPNITDVNIKQDNLSVECGSSNGVDITEAFFANFSFTPDATYKPVEGELESDNAEVCSLTYNADSQTWFVLAKAIGNAGITIMHKAERTALSGGKLVTSSAVAASKFRVTVVQGLTGFTLDDVVMSLNEVGKLALTPIPSTATVDASKVKIEVKTSNFNGWSLARAQINNESYALDWLLFPEAVGKGEIHVYYDGVEFGYALITIGQPFIQKAGWAWVTPYGGDVEGFKTIYGESVQEVRSQSSLMYNDPVYGYFGDLEKMYVLKGYKVNIKEDESVYGFNENVTYNPYSTFDLVLSPKWNWIGIPYQFNRAISDIFMAGSVTKGDRIVSKDNGFAEFDGESWVGDLTTIVAGEGYLYYSALETEDLTVSLSAEGSLGKPTSQANAVVAKRNSVWNYDGSQFADNMSIIADLGGEFASERYSVGAFINGECRGEGTVVDGKWFITVHGDAASSGQNISFRIYDTVTGNTLDIESTQPYAQMAGTLSAPVILKAPSAVDDIVYDNAGAISENAKYYSIDGVEVTNPTTGLYIVVDGNSVRKVYVK